MSENNLKKRYRLWLWIGSIFALAGIGMPIILYFKSELKKPEDLATFGDFLGGSTVGLLSLASVFFFLAALTMQKEELKNSILELKSTNQSFSKQNIDNTFFNLMEYIGKLAKKIHKENGFENYLSKYAYTHKKRKENEIVYRNLYNNIEEVFEILHNIKGNETDFSIGTLSNIHHLITRKEHVEKVLLEAIAFEEMVENEDTSIIDVITRKQSYEEAERDYYTEEEYENELQYMEHEQYYEYFNEIEEILLGLFKKHRKYFEENYNFQIDLESYDVKRKIYSDYFYESAYDLLHYFKNVSALIEFILNADLNVEEKKIYFLILDAQLSLYERKILELNLKYIDYFQDNNYKLKEFGFEFFNELEFINNKEKSTH